MKKPNSEIEAVFQEVITSLKPVTGLNERDLEAKVAGDLFGQPVENVNSMTLDDLRGAMLNYLEMVNEEMNQALFDEKFDENDDGPTHA